MLNSFDKYLSNNSLIDESFLKLSALMCTPDASRLNIIVIHILMIFSNQSVAL